MDNYEIGITYVLTDWLKELAIRFRNGERPEQVQGPFGNHGVYYVDDDADGQGPYAVVGFCIIEAQDVGWLAETDDGTYGRLQGFRLYFADQDLNY